MKPKDRIIAALELKEPDDMVPHFEMNFQLCFEEFGIDHPERGEIFKASLSQKEKLICQDVELYIRVAERFNWSAIPLWRYYSNEAVFMAAKVARKMVGDKYLIASFNSGGTYGIPERNSFEEFTFALYDKPDDLHRQAKKRIEKEVLWCKRMIDAGIELIVLNEDYCYNSGPYISPKMFEEFVTPYLCWVVKELKEAGAHVMIHTDGNIMPIIDQLLEAKPHALQSLDPMAGVDIAEVKRLYGDQVCLMGNVNCSLLQEGTKDEIMENSRYAIQNAGPGGGYIFSSSNVIFKGMPLEHYYYMLEALEKYGKYPMITGESKIKN